MTTRVYIAVPGAGEVLPQANDFAFCQICQLTENHEIILNPTNALGWEQNQHNQIKINTLDPQTGWFIDHLSGGWNNNFLYYMNSFDPEDWNGLLNAINQNQQGGVLYTQATGTPVTPQDYQEQYQPNVAMVGQQAGQYPLIRDTPNQDANRRLDFQVHVLSRQVNNVHIHGGFTYYYQGDTHHITTESVKIVPSLEFTARVNQCIELQNNVNQTHWQLAQPA